MRYDICLQSFVHTVGVVMSDPVNVFNGTCKSRQEAGAIALQALGSAAEMFGRYPDFEIIGSPDNVEIHIVVRAFGHVIVKIDAVPLRMIARRGEARPTSIEVMSPSRLLN